MLHLKRRQTKVGGGVVQKMKRVADLRAARLARWELGYCGKILDISSTREIIGGGGGE
jgi:hypothetical protein